MFWNFFQWHSLKTRLTLFTLTIFVISIWSLAFYVSRTLREDMQRQLGAQQFSTVSMLAAEIEQAVGDRLSAVETAAKAITPPILGNTADLQKFLEEHPIFTGHFSGGVWVTRDDGIANASVPSASGRIGINFTDREYMIAVLKEGKSTISKPIIGRASGAANFVIATPIRDPKGNVIGALVGVTDLNKPNFLDNFFKSTYGKTGGYILIAPQHGLIVTATDKSRIMTVMPALGINPLFDRYVQGYEGSGSIVDSRGLEVLSSAKAVPVAGWILVGRIPVEEAFAPIRVMRQRILLATILLTLLAGVLTWWMIKRQLAPMLATVKALAQLSESNLPPQALLIVRQDEIGELIGGFNRLLQTLGKQREALSVSEYRSRAIIEASPVPMAINDEQGNITLLNQAFVQVVGYALNDIPTLADWWLRAYPDLEYRQRVADNWQKNLDEAIRTGKPFAPMELNIRCKDDLVRTFIGSAAAFEEKYSGSHLVILYDITERKRAEESLREGEEKYRTLIQKIHTAVVVHAPDTRILTCNPMAQELLGLTEDQLLGKTAIDPAWHFFRDDGTEMGVEEYPINQVIARRQAVSNFILGVRRPNRNDVWVLVNADPVFVNETEIVQVIVTFIDITERKQAEGQVREMAFYDTLTKLPNRRLLGDRLNQTLAASKRSGCYGAMMFLDLDNFKQINDAHGHEIGDLLLIETAKRLNACVREVDTVARFGGDEFVVIVSELDADRAKCAAQARLIAEKIRSALAKPFVLNIQNEGKGGTTVEHYCPASIGVALFGKDEASQDDILKRADTAMYQAKEAGRNSIRFYDLQG